MAQMGETRKWLTEYPDSGVRGSWKLKAGRPFHLREVIDAQVSGEVYSGDDQTRNSYLHRTLLRTSTLSARVVVTFWLLCDWIDLQLYSHRSCHIGIANRVFNDGHKTCAHTWPKFCQLYKLKVQICTEFIMMT